MGDSESHGGSLTADEGQGQSLGERDRWCGIRKCELVEGLGKSWVVENVDNTERHGVLGK